MIRRVLPRKLPLLANSCRLIEGRLRLQKFGSPTSHSAFPPSDGFRTGRKLGGTARIGANQLPMADCPPTVGLADSPAAVRRRTDCHVWAARLPPKRRLSVTNHARLADRLGRLAADMRLSVSTQINTNEIDLCPSQMGQISTSWPH